MMTIHKILLKLLYLAGLIIILFLGWKWLTMFLFPGLFQLISPVYIFLIKIIFKLTIHNLPANEIANFLNGSKKLLIEGVFLSKFWWFISLIIIWFTHIKPRIKIVSSVFLFIIHIIFTPISLITLFLLNKYGFSYNESLQMAKGLLSIGFKLFVFLWILYYKDLVLLKINNIGITSNLTNLVRKNLVLIIGILIFFNNFFIGLIQFDWLIWFLFNTSGIIINLLGYNVTVDGKFLLGDNGNIYMDKYCIGIWLMFYFAAFIIFTGSKFKSRFLFITLGIICINIINIARFVFLFIHLQKNGNYKLAIDFHDLFNISVYIFILIAWIIWLEFYSDIWHFIKLQKLKLQ